MTDRPILFSGPMVCALLAGTKTQTRRVVHFDGIEKIAQFTPVATDNTTGRRVFEMKDRQGKLLTRPAGKGLCDYQFQPRYAAGDRLYVREAWHAARSLDSTRPRDIPRDSDIEHAATARGYAEIGLKGKLRPSMFLPRWASRLTLIVTDVRVQRLQDISEADAIAEGIARSPHANEDQWIDYPAGSSAAGWTDPRDSFRTLWDSLNAERGFGWDANPWVTATTFEVIKQNIDQIAEALHG